MKLRSLLSVLFLGILLAGMYPVAYAASSTITPVLASEDTYVDNAKPTTNFGSGTTMWIRGGTPIRRGLVRFNLSAIPVNAQISSAILKLYVSSDGSAVAGNVNTVSGSWAQNTVTYSTAPAVGALIAPIPNPASANTSMSVNITSYVAGKSIVNLYIVSSNSDGVVYYTHEKGSSVAPRLVVTWTTSSTATPTRTRTPTPSVTPTRVATRTPTPTGGATATFTKTATPSVTVTPSVSATPSASPTPATDSLTLPLRLAFYYPWFPESWTQGGVYPFTNYTPSLGYYDSSSTSVINKHIADMKYAGIQGGIAAWKGPGTATDGRIPTLLSAAAGSGFKWSLYYQAEGQGDPAADVISSDLTYIYNQYAQNESFLRIGGKPVLFVSGDAIDGCAMADRWKTANTSGFYVVLKVFAGYGDCASQPDGWHQYAPTSSYDSQGSHAVSISPGYWKKGSTELLARDLARWNQDIRDMVAANADFQLITTWNQWGEGTSVEASGEFGRAYLDALHDNGQIPPTIMAAGDIICDSLITSPAGCQQMAVSQLLVDRKPSAVLVLGDLCHTPSVDCFTNYFAPSWGRVFAKSHPTTGNHDYLVPGAVHYFDYWNGIGNADGPAGDRSKGYYSYDLGTWHVVALNSQCGDAGGCNLGSPQYAWLQQDLRDHPSLCTLAYYHIPVFSSGGRAEENMRQIYGLLYANNVDVVLDGHDHIYERFAPQDPTGMADPLRGIREFVVGTGGANHTSIVAVQPNSEVRNADTFGALKLTLRPDRYSWQFVPVAGMTFTDSGSNLCH